MASSPEMWQSEAIQSDESGAGHADADQLAVLIVDARKSNPCLVLANAAVRRVLTPAIVGGAFVGSSIQSWLSSPQAAVVLETLAGLSKLHPSAHRAVAWPFIWGEMPTMTEFKLLDWDPGQALVMLSFALDRPAEAYAVHPARRSTPAPVELPRGVAGLTAHLAPGGESAGRMRRSEDLLRATMANTADTLLFLDTELRVRFVNKAYRGQSVAQMVGMPFEALLPQGSREHVLALLRRTLASGEPVMVQITERDDDQSLCHGEIRANLVQDAGLGMGVCISLRDTTELKRLEREILEASTRERQRIGRDLHDGLGQELTGVALMLRALSTRLEREYPQAAGAANELVGLVNQSIENARSLAHGLLPVSIERGGLICALRSLADRSRDMYGIDVRFRAEMWPQLQLPETHASDIYRVAQEALTNVARHSGAANVRIMLHVNTDGYCLKIADNGIGFSSKDKVGGGMGMKIMRHRAEIIGAKLEILRNIPRGTLIRLTGPQTPILGGV